MSRPNVFSRRLREGFALLLGLVSSFSFANDSPNIILIFTDDQAWNGTSVAMDPNNPDSKSDFYQTPSLERLAAEGMRFSNAYSAAAVCSPTRAALVTGKSPGQINYQDLYYVDSVRGGLRHPLTPPQVLKLDPHQQGIADRVKQANADYATTLIGKWHLSGATPQDMGFDSWDELRMEATPEDPKGIMARSNAAVSFVEQQVAAEKPFFLQLSEFALHQPIRPTPENVAKYENLTPGSRHKSVEYAAYTEDLDTGIGNLLDRVDALGIRDNTYVIFASDNGSSVNDSRSTPLFSGKKSIFEGGIRSPLIISGPGIDENTHSAVPVTTMDLYSTVSDLVGNTSPVDVNVEGASLKALLENGGQLPDGTEYLQRAHAEQGALYFISPSNIASGSSYRLRPMAAVRQGDYKLIRIFGENGSPDEDLLFDMSASVAETETVSNALNLARIEPEVASELGQRLDNWIDSADVPLPYNVASDVTVQWLADRRSGHRDVVGGNEWRATTDIKQKFRETWYQSTSPQATPRRTSAESYQRSLPTESFTFDGDDRMSHQYFHVSDEVERISNRVFPTGDEDYDRSVSYEFWVRLQDLTNDHILFESGSPDRGLSVTLGDADNDGLHREARFRVVGENGESIAVTGDIGRYADPMKDLVHLAVVYSDDPNDRYAQIFANGHPVARTQGLSGTENSLHWDSFEQGFENASLGNASAAELGAAGGTGDLPFAAAGLRGEVAVVRYHNHSISAQEVLANYNDVLDPVGIGLDTLAGDLRLPASRPSSVGLGDFESDEVIVFEERRDQLAEDLPVDFLTAADGAGVLPADNLFTSYLFHFDPEGSDPLSTELVSGFAIFEKPILGVIFDSESLASTDSILGSVGNYGEETDRGLTLDEDNFFAISGEGNSLFFDFAVSGEEMIQFRVLTEKATLHPADLNFDAKVDFQDLAIWQEAYGVDDGGDINADGFSDGTDFLAFQRPFVEGISVPISADFDDDGDIDEDDLALWKAAFGVSRDADADLDGVSLGSDFLIWQRQRISNPDFNGDTVIDGDDLAMWRNAYGVNSEGDANSDTLSIGEDFLAWQNRTSAGGQAGFGSVPEPTSMALGISLIACALWRRERFHSRIA